MNEKNKITAEFRPELHFEVRPVAVAPFRAVHEDEFERLKSRLLSEKLFANSNPALNAPVRRAANEAAALAWVSFYPLLVFPVLFEEKVRAAVRQAGRQTRILAASRELATV
jgi:hypothetical protein